jgi:hypothetical protein
MTKPKLRVTYAIVAAALGLVLSASLITPALASPHFIGTPTCTTSSGTDTKTLTCSGRIGGLDNVSTVTAGLRVNVIVPCAGLPFLPSAAFPVSNGQTVFTASITFAATCPIPPHVTFSGITVVVDGFDALPIPGTFDP